MLGVGWKTGTDHAACCSVNVGQGTEYSWYSAPPVCLACFWLVSGMFFSAFFAGL